uniref:Uncharacterized protein n=1 Tax=Aplanochytrium stocchinoi TaxID=215587 RepID=A0A7S3LII4_9STRA
MAFKCLQKAYVDYRYNRYMEEQREKEGLEKKKEKMLNETSENDSIVWSDNEENSLFGFLPQNIYREPIDEKVIRDEYHLECIEEYKNWVKFSKKIDWKTMFPKIQSQVPSFSEISNDDLLKNHTLKLLPIDYAIILRSMEADDQPKLKVKCPYLSKLQYVYVGTLCFESFSERMISAGGNVYNAQRSKTDVKYVSKQTVLKMNRDYMERKKEQYPHIVKEALEQMHKSRAHQVKEKFFQSSFGTKVSFVPKESLSESVVVLDI